MRGLGPVRRLGVQGLTQELRHRRRTVGAEGAHVRHLPAADPVERPAEAAGALADLFDKLKDTGTGDEEDDDAAGERESPDAEEEDDVGAGVDAEEEDDDVRRTTRIRAETWARRRVRASASYP